MGRGLGGMLYSRVIAFRSFVCVFVLTFIFGVWTFESLNLIICISVSVFSSHL